MATPDDSIDESLLRCQMCKWYAVECVQIDCGERLCSFCYKQLVTTNAKECPVCKEEIDIKQTYKDIYIRKALMLMNDDVTCKIRCCHFIGSYADYLKHQCEGNTEHVEKLQTRVGKIEQDMKEIKEHTDDAIMGVKVIMQDIIRENRKAEILAGPNPGSNPKWQDKIQKTRSEIYKQREEVEALPEKVEFMLKELIMLQKKCTIVIANQEKLSTQFDCLKLHSTNGTFVWRIPEIIRRRRDAIEGKTVSLYSPPWRTWQFGYEVCLRCYLNGDGMGKGTHVSLFLVMMKCDYDDFLEWPAPIQCKVTLLNCTDRKDNISESFAADPHSQSFLKPVGLMNIASGFPRFAKNSVLEDPRFVVNNSIYIKIDVCTLRKADTVKTTINTVK